MILGEDVRKIQVSDIRGGCKHYKQVILGEDVHKTQVSDIRGDVHKTCQVSDVRGGCKHNTSE